MYTAWSFEVVQKVSTIMPHADYPHRRYGAYIAQVSPKGFLSAGLNIMHRSLLIVLVLFSIALSSAHAQVEPIARQQGAIDKLQHAYQLLGGETFSVHSVVLHGNVKFVSPSPAKMKSGTFEARLRNRDYLVITKIDGHDTRYSNIAEHALLMHDGKTQVLPVLQSLGRTSGFFPLFDRWTDYRIQATTVIAKEDISFFDEQCHHLKVTTSSSPNSIKYNEHGDIDVYVRTSDGTLRGVEYRTRESASGVKTPKIVFLYNDFKLQNGISSPMTVTRILDDKLKYVFVIDSIDLNKPLGNQELREMPGGVQ